MYNILYSNQAQIDLDDVISHLIYSLDIKTDSLFILRIYHGSTDYANNFNNKLS